MIRLFNLKTRAEFLTLNKFLLVKSCQQAKKFCHTKLSNTLRIKFLLIKFNQKSEKIPKSLIKQSTEKIVILELKRSDIVVFF